MIDVTGEMIDAFWAGHDAPEDGGTERGLAAVLAIVYRPDPHFYVCTACLHGLHDRCASPVRLDGGPKVPATCKWCTSPCRCLRHREVP